MPVLFRCARGHDWEAPADASAMETGGFACPVCGSGSQIRAAEDFLVATLLPRATPVPPPSVIDGTLVRSSIVQVSVESTDATLVRAHGESSPAPLSPSSI